MSRDDGSAYPPFPSDADWWTVFDISHRESDEPWDFPNEGDYDSALWPLLAGDVIQPHCMCGRFSTVGECEECQKELALYRHWDEEDARNRRERSGWRKPA